VVGEVVGVGLIGGGVGGVGVGLIRGGVEVIRVMW
jgi:hypothetical protein